MKEMTFDPHLMDLMVTDFIHAIRATQVPDPIVKMAFANFDLRPCGRCRQPCWTPCPPCVWCSRAILFASWPAREFDRSQNTIGIFRVFVDQFCGWQIYRNHDFRMWLDGLTVDTAFSRISTVDLRSYMGRLDQIGHETWRSSS